MPLTLFPVLKGLQFGTTMTPSFNTGIATSVNGKEVRNSYQAEPLWDFELSYEWLPNRREGRHDLETIMSFFLHRQGSFESFLFLAPETEMEDMITLGTGDGVTDTFSLLKSTGTFTQTAGGVMAQSDCQIYVNGVLVPDADFELVDHRDIVFDTAPAEDDLIQGCYQPLYRVRFAEDSSQYDQFMSRLWELQQLTLRSVFS